MRLDPADRRIDQEIAAVIAELEIEDDLVEAQAAIALVVEGEVGNGDRTAEFGEKQMMVEHCHGDPLNGTGHRDR